jgi:hypothetical protein
VGKGAEGGATKIMLSVMSLRSSNKNAICWCKKNGRLESSYCCTLQEKETCYRGMLELHGEPRTTDEDNGCAVGCCALMALLVWVRVVFDWVSAFVRFVNFDRGFGASNTL